MELPKSYFQSVLKEIMSIDSPSGFTKDIITKMKEYLDAMGYSYYETKKGNLVAAVKGKSGKNIGIASHVDTLGLMVRGFNSDGTLTFAKIGYPILPTLDGEYCKIYTRCGKVYTGTILSNAPSSHVYPDANELKRDSENMCVKLDEEVHSAEDTKKLGIMAGDFICFDPKTVITETGFIKSRFLDDKLSVAIVLAAMHELKGKTPEHNLTFIFTTYEETGTGLSHLPVEADELLAVDMGCIGLDLTCTEYDVSICAKDSSGPYDYDLTTKLINLAKEANLSFAVDIYPSYVSDVTYAAEAGYDFKGALIGPGVASSHGMERSHMKAVENAWKLLMLYLSSK